MEIIITTDWGLFKSISEQLTSSGFTSKYFDNTSQGEGTAITRGNILDLTLGLAYREYKVTNLFGCVLFFGQNKKHKIKIILSKRQCSESELLIYTKNEVILKEKIHKKLEKFQNRSSCYTRTVYTKRKTACIDRATYRWLKQYFIFQALNTIHLHKE